MASKIYFTNDQRYVNTEFSASLNTGIIETQLSNFPSTSTAASFSQPQSYCTTLPALLGKLQPRIRCIILKQHKNAEKRPYIYQHLQSVSAISYNCWLTCQWKFTEQRWLDGKFLLNISKAWHIPAPPTPSEWPWRFQTLVYLPWKEFTIQYSSTHWQQSV